MLLERPLNSRHRPRLDKQEGDPDFCHLSDREDVRPEHFAVICENPYGVVKRFTVEVLDADAIEVNGERCTKADGAMPLSGRDIITAAGLEIIFVLAPAGEAAPASPAVAERDADEHEAGMEEWSAQRITDPILSPVGDATASDAAAWYGALCGEWRQQTFLSAAVLQRRALRRQRQPPLPSRRRGRQRLPAAKDQDGRRRGRPARPQG